MSIQYVDLDGFAYGVANDEAGMQIDTVDLEPTDPKEFVKNKRGQRRGFARNIDPSVKLSLKGEIITTAGALAGIPAATFGTVVTVANIPTGMGAAVAGIPLTGGFYLDTIKFSSGRTAWYSIDAALESLPLVT